MAILTTVVISFINILNLIKRSRYKIPIILMVTILWIIMGANTQNPDYYAYSINYDPNRVGSDIGYSILVKLFTYLGFSYSSFRMVISFFGIYLISRTVNKLVKNRSAFYLLYLIYPFFIDVVQIRNFLVMSILIFLVPYLLSENKIDKMKYVFGIFIASSFQVTTVFYLPLVFISKIKKNILYRMIIIISLIMIMFVSLNKPLLDIVSRWIILHFGDIDERISFYTRVQTNYGFLLLWTVQFINYTLIIWASKIFKRNKHSDQVNSVNKNISRENLKYSSFKYMEFIKWINIFAFFFFPFFVFQITFARLVRNIIPLNLIAFLITEQALFDNKKRNSLFRLSFITYHALLVWIDLSLLYPDINIIEIIKANWIL